VVDEQNETKGCLELPTFGEIIYAGSRPFHEGPRLYKQIPSRFLKVAPDGRAMRRFWTGTVLAASLAMGLALSAGLPMRAQMGGGGAGGGRGGRGGGGGQAVMGIVTAATKDKVTVKTDAGDSYDITLADTSRVMKDGKEIKLSDVKVGDSVTARGAIDATKKTVQATMVMDVDADTVKKAKEDMGVTYITGRITAIDADNLKLTIMRTDQVSQVIAVDEGTSFQQGARGITVPSMMGAMGAGGAGGRGGGAGGRGGGGAGGAEAAPPVSITLADIKVGDSVVATGGLKAGVFVPAKMGVTEPGQGGGRRGAGAANAPAAPVTPAPPEAPPQ
jgi:hypothetical protein